MAEIITTYNTKDHIWSSEKQPSVFNKDTSLGKIIFSTMNNWPKNICQINDDDGVSVTNAQGITWAIRIAQYLKKRGLDYNDVVGIVARTSTYLLPLGIACLMNTTPFHPVNPLQGEETIKHVFGITKPTLIFCDGEDYEKVSAATREWQPDIYTLTDPIEGVPKIETLLEPTKTEIFYEPEPLKTGADQTMAILCSSGTTGLPKAVCISNSTLIQESYRVNSESVLFIASSLDWITGLWTFILNVVFGSTRIITNKPFSPEYFVQLVNKYKIDYVSLPPRYLSALITCPDATEESLSIIRVLYCGGSMVTLATLQRAQELCKNAKLNSAYGITEVGAIAADFGFQNKNVAGKPLPGNKIRIVDEDGKNLSYNQVGEIYVHNGRTWNGYYGNPEETRRMQDLDGWFHTGDLGYFDEQNLLYIVDRKKETLKYQGLHYWASEIETVIAELPQIQDVCVVGIYDESHGDAAGALIVKRKGCEISSEEIIDHVAKRLTGIQKQLHAGVRFTDKLPANVNGKTIKKAVQEIFVTQNGTSK